MHNAPPFFENPSCEHTTSASLSLHPSSHTLPHTSLVHNSTLPSLSVEPPTNLIEPLLSQAAEYVNNYYLTHLF